MEKIQPGKLRAMLEKKLHCRQTAERRAEYREAGGAYRSGWSVESGAEWSERGRGIEGERPMSSLIVSEVPLHSGAPRYKQKLDI